MWGAAKIGGFALTVGLASDIWFWANSHFLGYNSTTKPTKA